MTKFDVKKTVIKSAKIAGATLSLGWAVLVATVAWNTVINKVDALSDTIAA